MSECRVVDLKELGISKELFDCIYSMGEQDGRTDAIDEYEDMLLEWANNHQCRLDRMDVINIANRLKENKNDNR